MSDNQVKENENGAQSAETENTDTQTVPYDRFKEVNEGYKALKAKMAELQAAEETRQAEADKAKKKQLEEQARFKELYETAESEKTQAAEAVKAMSEKLEAMEAALTAQWEAQKGLVPELYQELVEQLDLTKRLKWLADNKEKLTTDNTNGTPKRSIRKPVPEPTGQGKRRPAVSF